MQERKTDVLQAVLVQMDVIHALVIRETRTRYGGTYLGFLWAFVETGAWVGMFVLIFYLADRASPYGMSIVPFIATGLIPTLMVRRIAKRMISAISANIQLLYFPQIQPLDLMITRGIIEVATYFVVFGMFIGGHGLYSGALTVDQPFKVLFGLTLASLLSVSLGMCLSGLNVYWNSVERIASPALRPLIFLSGAFYTAEDIPREMLDILLLNPVFHIVEYIRDGYFTTYTSTHADLVYVGSFIFVFLWLGLMLERTSRRRLQL